MSTGSLAILYRFSVFYLTYCACYQFRIALRSEIWPSLDMLVTAIRGQFQFPSTSENHPYGMPKWYYKFDASIIMCMIHTIYWTNPLNYCNFSYLFMYITYHLTFFLSFFFFKQKVFRFCIHKKYFQKCAQNPIFSWNKQ